MRSFVVGLVIAQFVSSAIDAVTGPAGLSDQMNTG